MPPFSGPKDAVPQNHLKKGTTQTLSIRNLHSHTGPTGTLQWVAATETHRGAAEHLQTTPESVLHCSGGRGTLEDTALKTRKSS